LTGEVTDNPTGAVVAVTRVGDYRDEDVLEAVRRQFELLGGLDRFIARGDRVLLKPNFIVPRRRELAAQTDPAVILAVARLVKDFGARPFVGDSPAWGNFESCLQALELAEPLRRLGVPFGPLDRPRRLRIDGSLVSISRVALDADRIINLPKFKAHQQLGATFAVKNMFGAVCGKQKAFWHFARGKSHDAFCTMLIEIYRLLAPAVSIIDGIVAMEGQGPVSGTARPLGFLVGGADPVACEVVCCDLIGLETDCLPIIRTARKRGFGCADLKRIHVVGDDYADSRCGDFCFARITPLDFSLFRVCRSICRQLLFLARCSLGRGGDKSQGAGDK